MGPAEAGRRFAIDGELVTVAAYGRGHIHDTFLSVYREGAHERRYVHQRLNRHVFPRADLVMSNVAAVTRHLRSRLEAEGAAEIDRRVLTLVPGRDGGDFVVDEAGAWWRTYLFISGTRSVDTAQTAGDAFEAGRAFGDFQRLLMDYEGPAVAETIPRFHDTRDRFEAFRRALSADRGRRAAEVTAEVRFALDREPCVDQLLNLAARGLARVRLTHNDTKINNVLLDEETGQGLCVIDLDTVMPGLALYDYGDLVRTATATAAEDERDLARVGVDEGLFKAVTAGYLSAAGELLSEAEKKHLVFGARLITFETGLRFLADHLEGDAYFKVHRPGHNLDRCRTQFKLTQVLEERDHRLQELVAEALTARAGISEGG